MTSSSVPDDEKEPSARVLRERERLRKACDRKPTGRQAEEARLEGARSRVGSLRRKLQKRARDKGGELVDVPEDA